MLSAGLRGIQHADREVGAGKLANGVNSQALPVPHETHPKAFGLALRMLPPENMADLQVRVFGDTRQATGLDVERSGQARCPGKG